MTNPETRDAAIREAKRYIRDIVRNDWIFEPSTSTTGPRFQTAWPISEREVKEWRPREYEDSCSEFEPESDDGDAELEREAEREGLGEERRRKRRRAVEEEIGWNEGLRIWVERREAWSGARTRREISEREERLRGGAADGAGVVDGNNTATGFGDATDGDGSALAARTEESLTITGSDAQEDKPQQHTESNITESDPLPEDDHQHHEIPSPDSSTAYSVADESYIPVVPSILSETNPIRASITPSMYPSIYSKVIVQSLTPTVPINLADVTKAMVQGWKADGQWPPKPAATNIVLQDDATVKKKDDGTEKETKKKGGVASAVRKVLHFSGFHPHHHPFHRRGSSHSGHHHEHPGSPGPSNGR